MDLLEAMKARHSVRAYKNKPLEPAVKAELQRAIDEVNKESGLHMQLVIDEPKAFESKLATYGMFSGVTNYIALVGKKSADLEEKCGYYGEKIVLRAQQLGLHTCWVALTYKKIPGVFRIAPDEKLTVVISVGYGVHAGKAHKSKSAAQVSNLDADSPAWFKNGVEAALLAPTAINQQQFVLTRSGNTVAAKAKFGPHSKMDLGIVKYHFELGAGKENFTWAE